MHEPLDPKKIWKPRVKLDGRIAEIHDPEQIGFDGKVKILCGDDPHHIPGGETIDKQAGTGDGWGVQLTPADVNDAFFGIADHRGRDLAECHKLIGFLLSREEISEYEHQLLESAIDQARQHQIRDRRSWWQKLLGRNR